MKHAVQEFWLERARAAAAHARDYPLTVRPVELGNPVATYAQLEMSALDGTSLRARLVVPADGASHPVLLMFHDAMRGVRGWHHMTRFVALGLAVVALESRSGIEGLLVPEPAVIGDGLGVAMRTGVGEEPQRTGRVIPAAGAHAWTGTLEDALVLAHACARLEGLDAGELFTWGEGAGAGLALSVAALVGAHGACALNPLPAALAAESSTCDVALVAQGLSCPVLLGTGMLDLQAPPEAQDVIASGLRDVRHLRYPRYAHERVNAFEDEMMAFLVALLGS